MSEKFAGQAQPVPFGERLASSQAFAELFREGMALVEETATYLDGPGRQQSKKLERSAALAYATESMRLTTRLMQLASWLLLHRAVKEGEMSLAQASKEKSKVKLASTDNHDPNSTELLPAALGDLIARSQKLYAKVRRLDATISTRVRQSVRQLRTQSNGSLAFSKRLSGLNASDRPSFWQTKTPADAGVFYLPAKSLFLLFGLQEAGEFLLEAGHAAAAIEDLLLASGPGRMRFGVDVEVQDVTFLAPCGARGELAAVRHHDLDGVIAGMDILFHFFDSGRSKGADMPNLALLYRSQPKAASGCN